MDGNFKTCAISDDRGTRYGNPYGGGGEWFKLKLKGRQAVTRVQIAPHECGEKCKSFGQNVNIYTTVVDKSYNGGEKHIECRPVISDLLHNSGMTDYPCKHLNYGNIGQYIRFNVHTKSYERFDVPSVVGDYVKIWKSHGTLSICEVKVFVRTYKPYIAGKDKGKYSIDVPCYKVAMSKFLNIKL